MQKFRYHKINRTPYNCISNPFIMYQILPNPKWNPMLCDFIQHFLILQFSELSYYSPRIGELNRSGPKNNAWRTTDCRQYLELTCFFDNEESRIDI